MAKRAAWGAGSGEGHAASLKRLVPTFSYLERRARQRIPGFAFDFVEGGTGEHLGARRNHQALDAIEIVPRYGHWTTPDTRVNLFGRDYASPLGISPVGVDGLVWPGISQLLARAAQSRRVPYVLGTLASASLEQIVPLCPDYLWLQLYGMPLDDYRVTFDMVERANRLGVKVLVATLDAPVRAKRPSDLRNGLVVPFRPNLKTFWQVATSLPWALALLKSGSPRFRNIECYVEGAPDMGACAGFVQREIKGSFDWSTLARLREHWPHALVVKGIQHPEDALQAVRLGMDGILVSNHGGRQSDAAPPAIDVLPGIAREVGTRATLLFDSGIRSGLDVARALALGARSTFSGRACLYGVAALGRDGALYALDMLDEELKTAMAQNGIDNLEGWRSCSLRHPGAWSFDQ